MLVPDLETLVYIGRDLNGEQNGMLYFQDYESFAEWGGFPKSNDGSATIFRCMADKITCIFNLDKAINILQQRHKRRAKQLRA